MGGDSRRVQGRAGVDQRLTLGAKSDGAGGGQRSTNSARPHAVASASVPGPFRIWD